MENKKHYVITLSTGAYEDVDFQVIAITDDFEKGMAYVEGKNSIHQSVKQKMKDYYSKEIPKWMIDNPKPIYREELKDLKLCKNKEQVSEDKRFNKAIEEKFHKDYSDWINIQQEFRKSWLAANVSAEEEEVNKYDEYSYWEIEEVAYL